MQRLMSLGDSSRIYPVVISGRSRENVESWLGALPIHLFAEHGLWERPPHGEWRSLLNSVDEEWKEHVREMLERACLEVPGSFVEEKAQSLVWHYRASDPGLSEGKARELHFHLVDALANEPLQVVSGK